MLKHSQDFEEDLKVKGHSSMVDRRASHRNWVMWGTMSRNMDLKGV